MKTGVSGLLMAVILFSLTGCQSIGEQEAAAEPETIMQSEVTASDLTEEVNEKANKEGSEEEPQPAASEKEGFILFDNQEETDTFLLFADCVCEYDNGEFQIYSKYFDKKNQHFTDAGTVFYMQTAHNNIQVFAADEYCIDYENGALYLVERDQYDYFNSIYKYCAVPEGGHMEVCGSEILSLSSVEELIAEPFALMLSDAEENFWIKTVYITALENELGSVVLKGEAYSSYNPTRECYHVDWEIDTATGEKKSTPHEKKIYDEEKDKEIFEACEEAFLEKDEGNWLELSDLKDWHSFIDWESIQGYKEANLWLRVDINGDNLPELISVRAYEDSFILPIDSIYTYAGAVMKPIDRVYWDPTDHSEFLYFGSTGNLIYENCDGGMVIQGRFTWCQFDEAWRKTSLTKLEFDYFEGETEISNKEEEAFLRESYPDTYGSRGAGCYCYKSRPQTAEELKNGGDETKLVREEITLEAFLKEYEQITGFDFFEAYPYYEYIR